MEHKKLCRSMSDKAICGVCSGFARYFDVDPIIIRLVVVLLALTGTIGIWFYIIAAIVMPKDTVVYAQAAYQYDPQTGRPLYSDGASVYENYARSDSAPVQDAEFTSQPYGTGNADAAENYGAAAGVQTETAEAGDAAGEWSDARTSEESRPQEQPAAEAVREAQGAAEAVREAEGAARGSWSEQSKSAQPESGRAQGTQQESCRVQGTQQESCRAQGTQRAQQNQDPYRNFQAYGAPQPQKAKKSNRNRNTGILLIVVGVVILAKIILPRISIWIPISIASIFFGIFLLCRKD